MSRFQFSDDAFGDRFDLTRLPLRRPAAGYAVQMLDTDQLLDRTSGVFLPIRSPRLACLFASFDEAHANASKWVATHALVATDHKLAIIPAGFDEILERPILIYGVLCGQP